VLERVSSSLESGIPVRVLKLSEEESALLSTLNLLTQKPCIYAANVCESDLRTEGSGNVYLENLRDLARSEGSSVCIVSAKVLAFSN
jgi:ribosome-binding ATPase YchF (GTP1/OBG family)